MTGYVRARAPLRISFGGGGTDVPPYCDEHGGRVLNTTIDKWVHVLLEPLDEDTLRFHSMDLEEQAEYEVDQDLYPDGNLDLLTAVVDRFYEGRDTGIELTVRTDAPPGSGVGASSAVVVATIAAMKEWLGLPLTPYQMAKAAYEIERIDLGIDGGKQDQCSAAYGGFNYVEFEEENTLVNPLRPDASILNELEERLVLAHTGQSRVGAGIIEDQVDRYERKEEEVLKAMHELKALCVDMKEALLMGDIETFGTLLDEAWASKKKMSPKISTPRAESLYEAAVDAGALGGKISGAGGGGFMFFVTEYDSQPQVMQALRDEGCNPLNVDLVDEGAHGWTVSDDQRVVWHG